MIGRPVHQCLLRIVRPEGVEHFVASQRSPRAAACRRSIAFDSVMMSGATLCLLARKHAAGTAETGEDFVENQQDVIFVGERAQTL